MIDLAMVGFDLKSRRLKLLPFLSSDIAIFHKLNREPFVAEFIWDGDRIPLELAATTIQKNVKLFLQHRYGIWKIILIETQEIIGYTGLWFFFNESQPQLIYALSEKYTGNGYALEAARTIINYAFTDLSFKFLIAATDEPNTASQKVAQRLGMKYVERRMENDKPTLFYRIDNLNFTGDQ